MPFREVRKSPIFRIFSGFKAACCANRRSRRARNAAPLTGKVENMRSGLLAAVLISAPLFANDGSAKSTPAGGIQLKREARISMEKERLTISMDRVSVEYEFLNETDQDIATEVAFPVPEYDIGFQFTAAPSDLEGWHVWVEGKELKYETEAKAMLKGVDQAAVLRRMSIDIPTFGHWYYEGAKPVSDIQKLPKAAQDQLERLGLVHDFPTWSVRKTYHWSQVFPAHKILHVRHEYKPELGLEHLSLANLQGKEKEPYAKLSDSCVDPGLRKTLIAAVPNDNGFAEGYIEPRWVDYILTTANTWKTPIKDFELVIQKPRPEGKKRFYVSLCWDGKIEQRDAETFVTKLTNFIPRQELRVMFFQVGR
jgi:Domain of unknown function (DUF4424)